MAGTDVGTERFVKTAIDRSLQVAKGPAQGLLPDPKARVLPAVAMRIA